MKFFLKEAPANYADYHFPYTLWAETGDSDPVEPLYAAGYLPYSADLQAHAQLFYMARSLRVDLAHLALNKKRRYQQRQWQGHSLQKHWLTKLDFSQQFGDLPAALAQQWMQARFGTPYLSPERFTYIFSRPILTHVLCWLNNDNSLQAFALIVNMPSALHYWFLFYDPTAPASGHGYLVDFLHFAQARSYSFAYLGTAYGASSQYKSRGLAPVMFWDGNHWRTGSNAKF